jgi:hypothetical protein
MTGAFKGSRAGEGCLSETASPLTGEVLNYNEVTGRRTEAGNPVLLVHSCEMILSLFLRLSIPHSG